MRPQSFKAKLLLAVSALVISSGLLISLLVTHRYSSSLIETMKAQAENLAHGMALEAADKILINDLVALQKMLDHQMRSNSAIAYLFISRDDSILAHTFVHGLPSGLLSANKVTSEGQTSFQEIVSTDDERYMDIAWPIFGGKAGVLRLGFSEKPYRRQLTRLWLQMSAITLGILLFALAGALLFVRRITSPLSELVQATQEIEKGKMSIRVNVQGPEEVERLSASFNQMVARMEEYNRTLEEQAMELGRAHHQAITSCSIVQEIGALRSLSEIGSLLISKFRDIQRCNHMALIIYNSKRDLIFLLSENGLKDLKEPEAIKNIMDILNGLSKVTFTKNINLEPPLAPEYFQKTGRKAIIPLQHENALFGALVIACSNDCKCDGKEIDIVSLILHQASGVINRALLQEEELRNIESRLKVSEEFCGIIGKDPKMQVIYKLIEDVAPTDTNVLIQGESGTGKEMVAWAIHKNSHRKDKPFVVINCSAYPATLLESELFGHEKGAFTGAIRQKPGRFEQAHGGTVFLDEIGEIPSSAQIKLLRVLQTQRFERLGSEKSMAVDVRILAATNKILLNEVKEGRFREDLFYRLSVIPVHLPLLRERPNDIPLLARHFLRRFTTEQEKNIQEFRTEAMRSLLDYHWPGNVRELENSVEHAVVLAKGDKVEASDLPAVVQARAPSFAQPGKPAPMEDHEKKLLHHALEESGWNKKRAAQRLGISRNTLYLKLKKYQISRPTTH